jgi:hypothetical protein
MRVIFYLPQVKYDKVTKCLLYQRAGGSMSHRIRHDSRWAEGDSYPKVTTLDGRRIRVHHHLFELIKGRLPKGMSVHHTCENKECLNVAHLEALTKAEHTRLHKPKKMKKWVAPFFKKEAGVH